MSLPNQACGEPGTASRDHDPRAARGLSTLFHPAAVAVVGASGNPLSPYARPVAYLSGYGFAGPIFPVNPKYDEIGGLRCYPTLRELPVAVDLVLVMTPAAAVPETVEQAAAAGATAVVVCSSGFAEVGAAGRRLEQQVGEIAAAAGVRVLGPNSQGLIFGPGRLAATFTAGLDGLDGLDGLATGDGAAGGGLATRGAAYVGQSGALGGCVLDHARERGLPVAAWVSTGNQSDLDAVEVAAALVTDDRINAIMLYLESVPDGGAYGELARQAEELGKPLVVQRAGRSAVGRRASASHTGATLRPETPFELVSARHGVVLTGEPRELPLAAQTAVAHRRAAGNRLAVITTSGGAGAVAADLAEPAGLEIPPFSAALRRELAGRIPAFGSSANPIDLTAQVLADASGAAEVCAAVAESGEADAVVFIVSMVTGGLARRLAEDLRDAARRLRVPLLPVWLAGDRHTKEARAVFAAAGLPVFCAIGEAVEAAARLTAAATRPDGPRPARPRRPEVAAAITAATTETLAALQGSTILESHGRALLDAARIPRPAAALVHSAPEALRQARLLGEPVVMKVQSPAIVHKTDVGGVRLDVPAHEVGKVYSELAAVAAAHATGDGRPEDAGEVLVQATAAPGIELLVGIVAAADGFPAVLTIGPGGTAAELHDDRAQTVLPVDGRTAYELIDSLRIAPALRGFRGRPPADVDALADLIVRFGAIAEALGDRLAELEINPVRVLPAGQGVLALDFLLRLQPGDEPARARANRTPVGAS